MRRLGAVLTGLLKKEGWGSLVIISEAERIWRELAGFPICDLARVDSYRDGTLVFRVRHPSVGAHIRRESGRLMKAFKAARLPILRLSWIVE